MTGEIPDSSDYIKDIALDFCKKQKLKAAILKSVDLLQSSSFDEIRDIIDNAINLGLDNDFGLTLIGYDYIFYVDRNVVGKYNNKSFTLYIPNFANCSPVLGPTPFNFVTGSLSNFKLENEFISGTLPRAKARKSG